MQIYAVVESTVQRNMDLIRELLLMVEADTRLNGKQWVRFADPGEMGLTDRSAEEVGHHLDLLIEQGFIEGKSGMETIPVLKKLTWNGHEFLDNIKNDDVWSKTKERIAGLKGIGISVVAAIAEAEIKKKLGLH